MSDAVCSAAVNGVTGSVIFIYFTVHPFMHVIPDTSNSLHIAYISSNINL
jgi:hypothetical protein